MNEEPATNDGNVNDAVESPAFGLVIALESVSLHCLPTLIS